MLLNVLRRMVSAIFYWGTFGQFFGQTPVIFAVQNENMFLPHLSKMMLNV